MTAPAARERHPAGFWIRLLALLLDVLVFVAVESSLRAIARRAWGPPLEGASLVQGLVVLFTLLFSACYVILLQTLGGQTIGKMLVGARVLSSDGTPLPLGASLLRYFAYGLSLLPLGTGFIMAGLRADKRGLHDLIAGSRVDRLLAPAPVQMPVVQPDGPTPSGLA